MHSIIFMPNGSERRFADIAEDFSFHEMTISKNVNNVQNVNDYYRRNTNERII